MGVILIILILISIAWAAVKFLALAGAAVIIAIAVIAAIIGVLAETEKGKRAVAKMKDNPATTMVIGFLGVPMIIALVIVAVGIIQSR